ncbi:ribosomal RNA small subunit methyltransferase, chloroplastic-like [Triticum dicoccoides]|uniref:ribosomal RNA small subunit methyltransferase, chloroplastic-like n=1 Tax=Triticum dicoccoides TaxID=85692 RepID=UPI0018914AF7|nr:ribosomal RNA small subunit methyltransferase, chloroplastic-like [Triticum dicoccoides]
MGSRRREEQRKTRFIGSDALIPASGHASSSPTTATSCILSASRPHPARSRHLTFTYDDGGTADDYHSTIRSLNSHGRRYVPRKSLGQDKHMATLVKDRFGSTVQLKIIEEDITKFHLHSHFVPILEDKSHGKVVSNLPFSVSTEVDEQIPPMGVFSVMMLMLQDETTLNLANASIQTPEYQPTINLFANFYCGKRVFL